MSPLKSIALAVVAVVSIAGTEYARAETDILVFGASHHLHDKPSGEWNEFNYGLGAEYSFGKPETGPAGADHHVWQRAGGRWIAGAFYVRDSCNRNAGAIYGGYRYVWPLSTNWRAEATIRAGWLKDCEYSGPAALPSLGLGYKALTVESAFIPRVHKGGSAAFVVWARISF